MITPAYSTTATERVLPRLALDFTTGALDPRVTVTRALNTATRVNSSGLIETVNANLPRFDYDPVTLQPKGLLIEEQRTNALAYSEELGNAVWTKSNASIVDNSTTAPDGLTTADTLVENTATSTHFVQSVASISGVAVVCSFFAKKKERSKVAFGGAGFNAQGFQAVWDLDNGTIFTNVGGKASMQALSNGWYRCSVAFTPSNAAGTIILLCDDTGSTTYTGDGTSGVYLWGMQTEVGAFLTSYIPTTTLAVLRNADVVSMTGTNFSDWYNASEGAFAANATTLSPLGSTQRIFSASTGSFADSISASASGVDLYCQCFTAGGLEANMFFAGGANNTSFRLSYAYKANNAAAALKAGTVTTDTSITLPAPNQLGIGNEGGFALFNGWISSIRFWPQRLTNAEVQAFSK
jgi:hypothetical protein